MMEILNWLNANPSVVIMICAAIVAAALGAGGETLLYDSGHILRGYEDMDERLRALGADVRVEEN